MFEKVIILIDMNAFYCSVEENRLPDQLTGNAFGVRQRGLLATVSYKAREAGVPKLVSVVEALNILPDLIIVESDMTRYRDASLMIMTFIRDLFPIEWVIFERASIDEAYLDVTNLVNHLLKTHKSVDEIINHWCGEVDEIHITKDCNNLKFLGYVIGEIDVCHESWEDDVGFDLITNSNRHKIYERLSIGSKIAWFIRNQLCTCLNYRTSAGIATNKILAKIGAGIHKPMNQSIILPNGIQYIRDLKIQNIPGVGSTYFKLLDSKKIHSLMDIKNIANKELEFILPSSVVNYLRDAYHSIDKSLVVEKTLIARFTAESMCNPRTIDDARAIISEQINRMHARLVQEKSIFNRVPCNIGVHIWTKRRKWVKSGVYEFHSLQDEQKFQVFFLKLYNDLLSDIIQKQAFQELPSIHNLGCSASRFKQLEETHSMDSYLIKDSNRKKKNFVESKNIIHSKFGIPRAKKKVKTIDQFLSKKDVSSTEVKTCPKCHHKITVAKYIEHLDHHFALDLYKSEL